uniref:N/A n=1 Tax=Ganoderma boninense TaxID=34458 RepID=A0A5K1JTC0_9APHY|nr:N/A [Ganoderma boninense]
MSDLNPQVVASSWLADYSAAFATQNLDALAGLFLPDGWLRDLLVFTWDTRSLEGREKIKAFLLPTLSGAQVSDFKLDESAHLMPRTSDILKFRRQTSIGAAQIGLQIAARFKQMDLSALVIERTARVGDVWRNRYPSLALHTPRKQHTLLYQPYPDNWPVYTPRDKVANWLEQYASVQDLVVWTSAELQPCPKYDEATREWDVTVIREGKEYKLRPVHIIMATGTLGAPNVPRVSGADVFKGRLCHSVEYNGPEEFTGKRVVVIGAGNTAIDICQDLALTGVREVTMVQRSSTCVMARDFMTEIIKHVFPEGVPMPVSDLRNAALPYGLLKKLNIRAQAYMWQAQKELYDKLRQDKGGADLIAEGRIKVKHGVEIDHLAENSVVFTDGSELPADIVVLATGYLNMKDTNRALLGEDIIDKTGELYGLDDEGELRSSYRPSGQPGLWYATGDFFHGRFMSKILGMQIKARQLGLVKPDQS